MECQQHGDDRNRRPDGHPETPAPLEPGMRGSDGRRGPRLVLSALVALIGLVTVGSVLRTPSLEAAAVAIGGLGAIVATAGGYNTLRQAIDVRPSIAADVATVCCGLCLVLTALTLDQTASVFRITFASGTLAAIFAGYNGYRTRRNRTISRDSISRG